MLKRSLLSITRRKNKTFIMAILMFIIANLVLATIAIKNATDEQINFAKKTIGGEVYLSADMESIRKEQIGNNEDTSEGPKMMKMERPKANINDVQKISELNYVKDFSYEISTTANSNSIDVISSSMSDNMKNRPGMDDFMKNMGNIQIRGINSYAFIDEVKNNAMTLSSGTYFDENTNDKIIISYELATLNNLNVGDKITLTSNESETNYDLEIIGIYDIKSEDENNDRSFINSGNKIYMNVETAAKFLNTEDYNEGNYCVDNVVYYLNNPEDSDKFISDANKTVTTLGDSNLKLDIDNTSYETMVGPIESVGSFANMVLIVVIIAAVVIISLMINSQIKERKYEMGVLLSLGETKKHIIGQVIIELILIATASFILSTGTSLFVAKSISSNLLSQQINMSQEQTNNNFGRPGAINNRIPGEIKSNSKNSNVEVIDKLEVNANAKDYAILFIIGYVIIGISMIIPTINIIKYEPKTILTRRDA